MAGAKPITRFGPQDCKADVPENLNSEGVPQFYECGICNCYHPLAWDGDCRDDANRFAADELDEKYGGSEKWEEVDMPGGEED